MLLVLISSNFHPVTLVVHGWMDSAGVKKKSRMPTGRLVNTGVPDLRWSHQLIRSGRSTCFSLALQRKEMAHFYADFERSMQRT